MRIFSRQRKSIIVIVVVYSKETKWNRVGLCRFFSAKRIQWESDKIGRCLRAKSLINLNRFDFIHIRSSSDVVFLGMIDYVMQTTNY